jgi:hypothetical protein
MIRAKLIVMREELGRIETNGTGGAPFLERWAFKERLRAVGYEVLAASDAASGLRHASWVEPHGFDRRVERFDHTEADGPSGNRSPGAARLL